MKVAAVAQVIALYLPVALAATSLTVTVPAELKSQFRPVAPDLISFSIEQDRWLDWVGSSKRNEFFYNALDNLKQLAGVPPRIRVGGRSQDVAFLNQNGQGTNALYLNSTPSMPYPEPIAMWIGGDFYAAAKFLPEHTRLVHGLNFASTDDLRGFWQLAAIITTFDSRDMKRAGVILDAIEVGNEPDMYAVRGPKPSNYDVYTFLGEWHSWATNVLAVEDVYYGTHVSYWGGALSRSSHNSTAWSPQALFEQGYRRSIAGERVTTFSQHHYSGSACAGGHSELSQLVAKSNIRKALDAFELDSRAARQYGAEYVLGEVSSSSCHGTAGVSDTAAAALWALDYALYSSVNLSHSRDSISHNPRSTLGISRVFFHQGVGYKSNFLQPITLTRSPTDGSQLPSPLLPHVNPQYYAAIIAAEAIGATNTTRILELPVEDNRIAAYLIYEGDELVRAVFINTQLHLPSSYGVFQARPAVRIRLNVPVYEVKRLAIPYADSTSGLSWGGVTYETPNAVRVGRRSLNALTLRKGSISMRQRRSSLTCLELAVH
ncbi:hypothetical protein NMY22_g2103 [Coprinellus aureogranulatus]|nr:hypothetical protein NMY22_g2103 [Coprinellus aureogranulatus]